MNNPQTTIAVALAMYAFRLSELAQLNVSTNFVPRCFTGSCILAAMNGSNITSDEQLSDIVSDNPFLKRDFPVESSLWA
ncbi:MAG TPA: hypothetical protein V6D14_05295 [Coleofasciculaceae cyanobacterium]|jgi:hypothetical protein